MFLFIVLLYASVASALAKICQEFLARTKPWPPWRGGGAEEEEGSRGGEVRKTRRCKQGGGARRWFYST